MRDVSMVFREAGPGVLVAPMTCGLLTVPDLIGHVRAWCAAPPSETLVIDLSEVADIDRAALRSIVWARRYCRAHGAELAVVLPVRGVLRTEEELLLRAFLPIVQAPSAAVKDGLVGA